MQSLPSRRIKSEDPVPAHGSYVRVCCGGLRGVLVCVSKCEAGVITTGHGNDKKGWTGLRREERSVEVRVE